LALAPGCTARRPVALDLDLGEVLAHNHPAREIACYFLRKDLQIVLLAAWPMTSQREHLISGARGDLADRVAGGQRVRDYVAELLSFSISTLAM